MAGECPGSYTVTFNKNGGNTEANPQTKTVISPAATIDAIPGEPTKTGYTFIEWNTQADGTGTAFTTSTPITGNITVYAKWQANAGTYMVTFNKNGGDTEANPSTKTVISPATTIDALPGEPTRTGYTFVEWNTTADGTGTAFTTTDIVNTNITVYAKWTVTDKTTYVIGDTGPAGGIIFYTDGTGDWKYLEAAPADISGVFKWVSTGFWGTDIPGTGTAIGSGKANTDAILAIDPNAPAAKVCKEYTGGGKTDWFLPSRDELAAMQVNIAAIGGFSNDIYWSSSQDDFEYDGRENLMDAAWAQFLADTPVSPGGPNPKYYAHYVRAVRAF
jgi:uncharacterized repeat protein (TIGR02543 family)